MGVVCRITSEAAQTAPFRLRLLVKQPKPRQILDEVRELLVAQFEPPPQAPPETHPISPRVRPRRQRAERLHAGDIINHEHFLNLATA